jgi:hypothetical protein
MRGAGGTLYGPVFDRGGAAADFTVEVRSIAGRATAVEVELQHRDGGETTWTRVAAATPLAVPGCCTLAVSGVREKLRFVVVADGCDGDAVAVEVAPPRWRD